MTRDGDPLDVGILHTCAALPGALHQVPQLARDAQEQADVRPEAGKMSRDEAKQLLDSLKSDDRKMPLAPATRGAESARNDEPVKDW